MSSEDRRVLTVAGFAVLCCLPLRALAPPAPPLGNAASFAVLGGSAVNNSGPTVVTGNLGVSPCNTITGFPPGKVKLGDTFKNDALAKAAHNDAGVAYAQLGTGPCIFLSPISSASAPVPPDTYCVSSHARLTGTLTLDAKNVPGAVWIFRITGALATDPNSFVIAINGAQPGNVFWQVTGSANLGADSAFVGNLIAHDNITLNSGANAFGRLLSLTGTVTLDSNNVTLCSTCNAITLDPPTLPDGTVNVPYVQTISASGGMAAYTFKRISGVLPKGLILTPGGVLSGTPLESGPFQFTVAATDAQGCSGERSYTIAIACQGPSLSPSTLQDAKACVHYEQLITASGGSGMYDFKAGPLPPWLSLCPTNITSSVLLCGTPPIPDTSTFPVTAKDKITGCVVTRIYTLKVLCNVMLFPETLPPAATCVQYCQTFTASCGTPPYTFSISSGAPPAGLLLSPDGMLCGIHTTSDDSTFTVTATDARGCTGSRTYTLNTACHITILPPALLNGTVNVPYSQQLTASCVAPPYKFTQVTGFLPPGFLPLPPSGLLSGTPTAPGVYQFQVMATDANGCTDTIEYKIFICPLTISPATLPSGTVGIQYTQPITAIDGSGSYTFSVPADTLPPGLTLTPVDPTPGLTATISGMPTTSGTYTFTVTATDTVSGCVGSQTYTIMVPCSLVISPAILSMGAIGVPYNETLTASGGTAPYTFIISSGALPTGLSLSSSGVISGTPLVLGTFNFCITVTDANTPPCGPTTRCYTIIVAAGGPTLSGWGMLVLSVLLMGVGLVVITGGGAE
jgi:large repetitive protein